MSDRRVPVPTLVALGLLSLVAFGAWFYGYGVLLEPIRQDTGWSESLLTSIYGASLLATGLGAVLAGRLIDRGGVRRLFLVCAALGGGGLLVASWVTSPGPFAVVSLTAGGAIGAGGYYPATSAVMATVAPERRTEGITGITLFGAFASPVFLPLIGWLVTAIGWRPTVRVLGGVVVVAFLAAVAAVPARAAATAREETLGAALRRVSSDPPLRRFMLVGLAAGVATSLLFLYQVPVMVDAGLALPLASGLAGARGLVQVAGRLPLPPVVRRAGSDRAFRGSFALTAVALVLLPGSGRLAVAIAFVAVAGVATGAMAALEGIYGADLTEDDLGTVLGGFSLVRGVGAALGPILGGVAADVVGSRLPTLLAAASAAVVAALLVPSLSSSRGAAADAGGSTPSGRPAGT